MPILLYFVGVPNDFRLDYGNHIGHRPFVSINRNLEDLSKTNAPTIGILADAGTLIALSKV